jgi:hypothetical protein
MPMLSPYAVVAMLAVLAVPTSGTAQAPSAFTTIGVERCGRSVQGTGKDAAAAERKARYRCRIRAGWDCEHLIATATLPGPEGDRCAAIATHRLGLCHFLAKAAVGSDEQDAKTKAVAACSAVDAARECRVRSSDWTCR